MTVFGCPEASADILRRSAISFNTGKPQILYSVLNKIAQSNVGTDRIAGVDFLYMGEFVTPVSVGIITPAAEVVIPLLRTVQTKHQLILSSGPETPKIAPCRRRSWTPI